MGDMGNWKNLVDTEMVTLDTHRARHRKGPPPSHPSALVLCYNIQG